MSALTWSAGGHSIPVLRGDGYYSFTIPMGVAGVAIGLAARDLSVSPDDTTHGIRFGRGMYQVVDGGLIRTAPTAYSSTEVFHIVRVGRQVYYCKGSIAVDVPGSPVRMPGTVIYTSDLPIQLGPMLLDAALLGPGDRVNGASLTSLGGGVSVAFRPMAAVASQEANNSASVLMRPMTVIAGPGQGAALTMRPLAMAASQVVNNRATVAMRPMTVEGFNRPDAQNGAMLFSAAMYIEATAKGTSKDRANLRMQRLGAFGSQEFYSQGRVISAPMLALGFGMPGGTGSSINARMPAVQGLNRPPSEETITTTGTGLDLPEFTALGMLDNGAIGWDDQSFSAKLIQNVETVGVGLETLVLSDPPSPVLTTTGVGESAVVLDDEVFMLETVGVGTDSTLPSAVYRALIVDTVGRGRDRDYLGVTLQVHIAGVSLGGRGSDAADAGQTAMLRDVGIGTELLTIVTQGQPAIIEEVGVGADGGGAFPVLFIELEGVGIGDDLTVDTFLAFAEDVGVGSDEQEHDSNKPLLMLEGAGIGDDAQTLRSTAALLLVADVGVGSDCPILRGQGLMAWVMNTETTGVSWYEAWAFTGMAQVGDKILAIGPDGLAVVGGCDDAGLDIDADVQLGYTDFSTYSRTGRPNNDQWLKQHLVALFVGYRADGILDTKVQTQGNRTYTYKLEKQPAREPRNSRFKTGKGPCERFWRIGFANVGGCDFTINSMAAEVVPTKTRRI